MRTSKYSVLLLFGALGFSTVSWAGPVRRMVPPEAPDSLKDAARDCDRGDTRACGVAGEIWWRGQGVAPDLDAALPLLRRACGSGYQEFCSVSEELRLGGAYSTQTSLAMARQCDRGEAPACRELGIRYRTGTEAQRDIEHALELLGRACRGGDAPACSESEELMLPSDAPPTVRGAAAGCDRGMANQCAELGMFYATFDAANAARVLEGACELGDAQGCGTLGTMWFNGSGVRQDIDRAIDYLTRGCDGGYRAACDVSEEVGLPNGSSAENYELARRCDRGGEQACVELGELYVYGRTVPQRPERGLRLIQGACDAGTLQGCVSLAGLMRSGDAGEVELDEAYALYVDACDRGEASACYGLGQMYEAGESVPADLGVAWQLWDRSCQAGFARACEALPGASARLILHSDDAVAQNLASACDRGVFVSCFELAGHLESAADPSVTTQMTDALAMRACYNGVGGACARVRFPAACSMTTSDANGESTTTPTDFVDRAELTTDAYLLSIGGAGRSVLPQIPEWLDHPPIDARPVASWPSATNPDVWGVGASVDVNEAQRRIRVRTAEGGEAEFAFDAAGRMSGARSTGAAVETTVFRYNEDGRMTMAATEFADRREVVEFAYEGARVAAASIEVTGGDFEFRNEWTWPLNSAGFVEDAEIVSFNRSGSEWVYANEWVQHTVFDNAGNPLQSEVRSSDRQILRTHTFDYTCLQ